MKTSFLEEKQHETNLAATCMFVNTGPHSQLNSFIDFD